jgi:hypothetical protein
VRARLRQPVASRLPKRHNLNNPVRQTGVPPLDAFVAKNREGTTRSLPFRSTRREWLRSTRPGRLQPCSRSTSSAWPAAGPIRGCSRAGARDARGFEDPGTDCRSWQEWSGVSAGMTWSMARRDNGSGGPRPDPENGTATGRHGHGFQRSMPAVPRRPPRQRQRAWRVNLAANRWGRGRRQESRRPKQRS